MKVPIIWDYDIDENFKTLLFNSNISGIPLIYSVPVDLSEEPKQINSGREPVMMASISNDGKNLIYFQDEAGNEKFQLYLIPVAGGNPKPLTEKDQRTITIGWHPNGKEIVRSYVSTGAPIIETIDLQTKETALLKETSPIALDLHFSPDGKWLALTNMKKITNTEVMIINIEDPSDIIIYNLSDKTEECFPSWSPDSKKLAYLSNINGWRQVVIQEFQRDDKIFLELDKDEEVPEPSYRGDAVIWDPKGDKVYYIISKYSRTTLHSHQITGMRSTALPFPQGTLISPRISKNGKFITVLHSSMMSPFGIYIHELGTNNLFPLTSRKFDIDISQLKEPQSVWYESFDGRKIHAWHLPAIETKVPYPAVVHSHGGPWYQTYDSWLQGIILHIPFQNGFAVLSPNFRGSIGYGSEFQYLDLRDPGGGDLEDIVNGVKWLKKQPEIDNKKIGILGASYGGYMPLIALTKKPDVFNWGISMVPVVDFVQDYKLADALFKQFNITLLGGPPRGKYRELYIDRSPITHISKIKAPVLIMAGMADSRCPWPPIENFINELKKMNHPHKLAIVEKAGHVSSQLNHSEIIPIVSKMLEFIKNIIK
ncbi:MAG: prolyl oligopeptidase family serine peptidase [Candidatus Odinarchaeota archaeon]